MNILIHNIDVHKLYKHQLFICIRWN